MPKSEALSLPDWAFAYLQRLGLDRQTASFSFLSQLCRAHLQAFPFENVSKLLAAEIAVTPYTLPTDPFLQATALHHYGGTCYTLHTHFHHLLLALGFEAHLVMVGTSHAAIIVKLPEWDGESVYVDVGSAAPLFAPVRFQTDPDNRSRFGPDLIRIAADPHQPGRFRYLRYRQEELVSDTWHFHPEERRAAADFRDQVTRSFAPDATFLTCLRIHLYQLDRQRCVSLKDNVLRIIHADGSESQTRLRTAEEIEEAVHREFGLSSLPVARAIEVLQRRGIDLFREPA